MMPRYHSRLLPLLLLQVLIDGLWARAGGGLELDLSSDATDIRCHKEDTLSDLLPTGEPDSLACGVMESKCPGLGTYLACLCMSL